MKTFLNPGGATRGALAALSFGMLLMGCAGMAPQGAEAESAVLRAPDRKLRAAYLEARLAIESGQPEGAIQILEPLAESGGCPPEHLLALAEARLAVHDIEGATRQADTLLERDPEFIPAWKFRARLQRRQGRTAEAIGDLESALKLEPDNPDLLEEVGLLRLRTTRDWSWEEGTETPISRLIEIYTHLAEVQPGSQKVMALLILSSIYNQIGKPELAIENAKQAVELRSRDIRGHMALAEAYENAKMREEALGAYRQALLIDPDDAALRKNIVRLVDSLRRPGGIKGFYEELAGSFPRVLEIQQAYIAELLKAEDWKRAGEQLRHARSIWPGEMKFLLALIQVDFRLDRREEALELTRELIDSPDAGNQTLLELTDTLRAAGELETVIELLNRLLAELPEAARLGLYLANVQIEAGRKPDAVATLEKILEGLNAETGKGAETFIAIAMLGRLYVAEERFDDAHRLYDRALEVVEESKGSDILLLKARLYRFQRDPASAVPLLERLASGKEGASEATEQEALQLLLEIHVQAKDFKRAHEVVDAGLARQTELAERVKWVRMKAWLHWRAEEFVDAITILERLNSDDRENIDIALFLADVYGDAGQYGKAHSLVDGILEGAEPAMKSELELVKARLFREEGRMDEAVELIEGLIRVEPAEPRYRMIIGEFYHLSGRLEDAEKALKEAIRLSPEDAEAYNALGYFFAEAGVRLSEALELVQKALELKPDAGHILDSLGWVYYQQGDTTRAVEALERAVGRLNEDQSPDSVVFDHLGDAYHRHGDLERARESWERALDLKPDSPEILKKLESR